MNNPDNITFYSGTSGLLLPVPNKLHYPEDFKDKSRLAYYSSLMNSIEINSSFYKIPLASTVYKWSNEVPDQFRFTFKLYKDITHNKGLAFDPETLRKYMQVIAGAGRKKGCLLVQFPPSIRITDLPKLEMLFQQIRMNDEQMEWNTAIEFRHPSLYHEDSYELLEKYAMGMVVHDKSPASTPFTDINMPFVYLRFHGPDGNYRGHYSDEVLQEYAGYIKGWLLDRKTVYVYFNNTMGDALQNRSDLEHYMNSNYSR
ncbi:DUF72 domain-containing protein [Pedobacter sp. PWIIR3]